MRTKIFRYLVMFFAFILALFLVACGEAELEIKVGLEMKVGESQDLKALVDGKANSNVEWSIDNESVLKIEESKLKALSAGEATITCKYESVTASVKITVVTNEVNIDLELNGGALSETFANKRTSDDELTLPTPTKEGYDFAGWYASSDFSGNKITKLDSSNMDVTKLFAKWSELQYKVVYHLYNEDDNLETKEEVIKDFNNVKLYEPSYESYNVFSGWYNSDSFIYEYKTISKDNFVDGKLDLYGRIMSKGKSFNVVYEFNGGSNTYKSRSAMLADFLVDYNKVLGKSHKTIKLIGVTDTQPLTFHTFYNGTLADGTLVKDKWGWLAQYLYELSVKLLPNNNYNAAALKTLIDGTLDGSNTTQTTAISCSFRAFLNGIQLGSNKAVTVDFGVEKYANGFWNTLGSFQQYKEKAGGYNIDLPVLTKENYIFLGWYRDAEMTEGKVTSIYSDITLYAKFGESVPVQSIKIDNVPNDGVMKFTTYELNYTLSPGDASIKSVEFESSDPSIATIDSFGKIEGVGVGTVKIKVISNSLTGAYAEFDLKVYTPNYFDVSYETNSYVEVGKEIKLNANYLSKDITPKLTWATSDASIATVSDGVVKGVKKGNAIITVTETNSNDKFEFGVTVLGGEESDVVKFLASTNNANIFTRYNLLIGDGTEQDYYRDIYSSVNKILFNDPLTIDTSFEKSAMADTHHGGVKSSTEFITVHYTGNMSKGATARANANYMCQSTSAVSIHYVTGNDGIFHCLDDNYVAWHAGDGTTVEFKWYPTGVMYEEGDPTYPVWGISSNSKFKINGKETTIDVPTGTTEATKKVTGDTFMYNGVENKCINNMGLPFKIVNGEYYMGTTWWCYSQISAGRICSKGGNLNSVGIESAVNPESDLWWTWQRTAQLVAMLMEKFDLDITRVWGHHFYSAKNCPQPMLENDNEIWWELVEMIKAEYELRTKYKNSEITMAFDETYTNTNKYGRITKQLGIEPQLVKYAVTVKTGTKTEIIHLYSIVEGYYQR
ncbi:MAG: N-acetylmuramoyl-L-alanine amidase [Bacilli bacterium]|nr:N-acetylmuramoyl-L-alanine amidase [Bacilli bacterium]